MTNQSAQVVGDDGLGDLRRNSSCSLHAQAPLRVQQPAGQHCGHHINSRGTLGGESVCFKCLKDHIENKPEPAAPAQRLEFYDYKQVSHWTAEEVRGWVFLSVVYVETVQSVQEEIEAPSNLNNYCGRHREKKVAVREPQYLFGKPVDSGVYSVSEFLSLQEQLKRETFALVETEKRLQEFITENKILKEQLSEEERSHNRAIATENLLRRQAETMRDSLRVIADNQEKKIRELQALEDQEPMRRKLPDVIPIVSDEDQDDPIPF